MNKIVNAALAAVLGISLCACGSAETDTGKGWSRTGYFQDENSNTLSVTKPEEGTEGLLVSCALGEDAYSAVIAEDREALTGQLNNEQDETGDPVTVKITEEGEIGLLLEIEGTDPYHFKPVKVNKDAIIINISTEGSGFFNAVTESDSYETDEDFTSTFASISLEDPAEYTLAAKAQEGWTFRKWTKNGEDLSSEAEITVEFTENAGYAAVFVYGDGEDGQNPVMNFIGNYVCDRARALVEADGTENARITIEWADSASSLAKWVMSGRFDPETLTVEYDNCVRSFVEYSGSGEIANETVEYENGTGKIVFREGPSFVWSSDNDEHGELTFEWSQPAETEEAIGTVTVLVNGLNIRRAASREAASAGQAENGKEYPVYEITEDGSLTWYRIGEDEWIGCTQDYAEYKPQE